MPVSVAYHTVFQLLYLITLAIGLWFVFYYSFVPQWVYSFFGIAILIIIIGVLMKTFLFKPDTNVGPWAVAYLIFHIIAFILIIVGIGFVIKYSKIPWWVWVILGSAIILSIVSGMIFAFTSKGSLFGIVLYIFAFVLFLTGIIFVIYYSNAPWWTWAIILLAIVFSIIASVFDPLAAKPISPCPGVECTTDPCITVLPCPSTTATTTTCKSTQLMQTIPCENIQSKTYSPNIQLNIMDLPDAKIPEQNFK